MSDTPTPTPAHGLVAGKYEVLRLIGRGGMGSVWEGRHTSLGTRVAIKFVDPEHAASEEARSRFVTEARAAAAIQSKHAIQIHDHGLTDDGRPYIVMELLVGEPLDERIERLGRLSLRETARILSQVCRALTRAHEAGIIHRDLKPENIFLVRSSEDDDEIAKVLDFGIAKIRVPLGDQSPTSSTKTGAVLGTPHYMSPEQARGLRTIDHRTDLWSLGVIAFKCVTGVLPFEGESVGDLLVKICTGPLPVPSLLNRDAPASFDAWFARALDRDPDGRFADATELADALALVAGLGPRRGSAISDAQPRRSSPSALEPGRASAVEQTLPATASHTAGPFTAPAAPARSSRGRVLGIAVAVLLGGSVGVVAIARLAAPSKSVTPVGDVPRASPNMASAVSVTASAPASTPPPEPMPPPEAAHVSTALAHRAAKPAPPPPKPVASSAAHPAVRAPTTADPGY